MLTRRDVMKRSVQASVALCLPRGVSAQDDRSIEVNDVQSQLNKTRVRGVVKPSKMSI